MQQQRLNISRSDYDRERATKTITIENEPQKRLRSGTSHKNDYDRERATKTITIENDPQKRLRSRTSHKNDYDRERATKTITIENEPQKRLRSGTSHKNDYDRERATKTITIENEPQKRLRSRTSHKNEDMHGQVELPFVELRIYKNMPLLEITSVYLKKKKNNYKQGQITEMNNLLFPTDVVVIN